MGSTSKILISLGVIGLAYAIYKVVQKKTLKEPNLNPKSSQRFSGEVGTVYNEYGSPFVRHNIVQNRTNKDTDW